LNNNKSGQTNVIMDTPHYVEDITQNRPSQGYNRLSQNDNEINTNLLPNSQRQEQPGFLRRWFINPLIYIGTFFCSRRGDTPSEEENRIFSELPEKVNNLNTFNTLTKTRIGILVLYQNSELEYFTNLINSVKKEVHTFDILVKCISNLRK
jgi:hypothetical protein